MLQEEFTIRDEFPPTNYEQWRTLAEEALRGAPFEKLVSRRYEGIEVQPLYARGDAAADDDPCGFPGQRPFVRGSRPLGASKQGWDLRQTYAHPDLAVANQEILDDLNGGATSLMLRFDAAASRGLDPNDEAAAELAGTCGLMAYSLKDMIALLSRVPLDRVAIALDAGAAYIPAAAILASVWREQNVAPEQASGALNADPLRVLARCGELPCSLDDALASVAQLANWTAENYPQVSSVGVDTSPYHDAGATATQDLAFGVATGIEYLRAMTAAGLDVDAAAKQILSQIDLGTHHFLAIAKLRAARRLWSRAIEASGGSETAGAMRIHAKAGNRVLTKRDPYVNLLRNTVAVFAAGIGGAEVITSVPFDALLGLPDEFSRRIARNTANILEQEAHLNQVVDPAGGSWYLDSLTEELADRAWSIFQEVERQGGMRKALTSGWVAQQIGEAYSQRLKDLARRKEGITGVSEFPDVHEEPVEQLPLDMTALQKAAAERVASAKVDEQVLSRLSSASDRISAAVEAAASGATIGQLAKALGFGAQPVDSIERLEPHSFAKGYEDLRDASDRWLAEHGQRPRVFLAKIGPVAHHIARATYAKNFFEAGGFEVLGEEGYQDADAAAEAFTQSGANIAVICSSDKLYPDVVPAAAPKLKQSGARSVILAGHPGDNVEAWQSAGVDRFIFIKCDVLATLRELLQEEGVWSPDKDYAKG